MRDQATLAAAIGSLNIGERDLAAQLRAEVGPNTLVIADRGFYSFPLWRDYQSTGADLLWRLSATMKLPVHQVLPDGSYLSEIKKKSGPGKTWIPLHLVVDTPELATHIQVRVIEFSTDSDGPNENYRLITTITDPTDLNATELAHAYLQRWELETAFRQIECQLLEPSGTLRSKTPPMIRQEIWALLLTHYAIRAFITDAADTIDIDPDRISTIRAINIVRRSVTDAAALSPLTPNTTTASLPMTSQPASTHPAETAPTRASTKEETATPSPLRNQTNTDKPPNPASDSSPPRRRPN